MKLSLTLSRIPILLFLIIIAGCSKSVHDSKYTSNSSSVSLDSALNVLNMEMTRVDDYRRQKEIRLNALKKDL